MLIPETMGRSLEDLAGEEHEELEGHAEPLWYETLWSRLVGKRRSKENFAEEEDSGPSLFLTLPKANGLSNLSDGESVGARLVPGTTDLRDLKQLAQNSSDPWPESRPKA